MKPFTSSAIKLTAEGLFILDQTQLPHLEVWTWSSDPSAMVEIIRALKVRGAPLIGVAAALQLGLLAEQNPPRAEFEKALTDLRESRPTAVNLMNAIDRLRVTYEKNGVSAVPLEAQRICEEDVALCESLSKNGASVIGAKENILTHCNTGGLATAGLGTALGAIIQAHRDGKSMHVYVDETRPLLQGARLTTYELEKNKIPFTLICDSMAGFLMQKGRVDRVLLGADRIARNGDFANKVGTYSLAVLAKHHGLPFHVVAPRTTIDRKCPNGAAIPIEERQAAEVRSHWAPQQCEVWNPAFDVTPAELVTSWIFDHGVFNQAQIQSGEWLGE
jgi:methylthioribose-1-phosphate isomerase